MPATASGACPWAARFDRRSADLANALAGNGPDCAVLELTLRGGTFESLGNLGIALAGAPMEATIVGTDNRPRSLLIPHSTTLQAGNGSSWAGRSRGLGPTWP